jgi:hypothetical protein
LMYEKVKQLDQNFVLHRKLAKLNYGCWIGHGFAHYDSNPGLPDQWLGAGPEASRLKRLEMNRI